MNYAVSWHAPEMQRWTMGVSQNDGRFGQNCTISPDVAACVCAKVSLIMSWVKTNPPSSSFPTPTGKDRSQHATTDERNILAVRGS